MVEVFGVVSPQFDVLVWFLPNLMVLFVRFVYSCSGIKLFSCLQLKCFDCAMISSIPMGCTEIMFGTVQMFISMQINSGYINKASNLFYSIKLKKIRLFCFHAVWKEVDLSQLRRRKNKTTNILIFNVQPRFLEL